MDSQPNNTITLTKYGLAIAAIFLFGIFMRLNQLDYMAFHHDESIHAKYSWYVYTGDLQSYKYDPVYHGPFLYHFGALHFLLFGDSDFAARLPFAVEGIIMLILVWRLKPWLGSSGMLFTLLLTACSPILVYFSRFARNDITMAMVATGILLFALEYMRSKKTVDLVWMTIFLVLMYCIKENSYMTGFIFGSFIVMYALYHIFSYPKEARPRAVNDVFEDRLPLTKITMLYGLFSVFAFTYVYYGTHNPDFQMKLDEVRGSNPVYEIAYLRQAWAHFTETHPSAIVIWLAALVILIIVTFAAFTWIQKTFGKPKEDSSPLFQQIARHNIPVLLCLLVTLAIYSFLFTTMGTNPGGMRAGVVEYLLYWMGQQGNPRIPGPPTYFLARLTLYEAFPLLLSFIALLVYSFNGLRLFNWILFIITFTVSVYAYSHVILYETGNNAGTLLFWLIVVCAVVGLFLVKQLLWNLIPALSRVEETVNQALTSKHYQPDGLRVFLIYWSVLSILVYAMLEEKVPWLAVHQAQPIIFLAGIFLGDTWKQIPAGVGRYALIIFVVLMTAYQARTSILVNFYYPDDARETMVYTQTSHAIHLVLEEIEEAAERLGPDYMPPYPKKSIAATVGEAGWPYSWYLRHYRTDHFGDVDNALPQHGIPFVIGEMQHENRLNLWAKGDYTVRMFKHQVWWPYGQSEFPFTYFKTKGKPTKDAYNALLRYVLYRDMWDKNDPAVQPGSKNFMLYAKTPLLDPLEKPEAPPGFEQPPTPLSVLGQIGSMGVADGQFNEPRGVAVSPDGSKIYVLDGVNCRIQVFDQSLNHLQTIGSPGTEPGQFSPNYKGPNGGISIAPDGKIFITDTWHNDFGRINVFNPDGTPAPSIDRAGIQSFFAPRGLTTSNNRVFVSDTGNDQIVWYDLNGNYGGSIAKAIVNEPVGITVGPDGLIYVCDVENKRVVSFTQTGQLVKQFPVIGWKSEYEGAVNWIEPYVAVDAAGSIYVTDSTTNSIYRFDATGSRVTIGGGRNFANSGLNGPKGIAVDSQGNLYVADSRNHRILKLRFP